MSNFFDISVDADRLETKLAEIDERLDLLDLSSNGYTTTSDVEDTLDDYLRATTTMDRIADAVTPRLVTKLVGDEPVSALAERIAALETRFEASERVINLMSKLIKLLAES